jgi:RNA polymerase sigma factor (sigma-70 family)
MTHDEFELALKALYPKLLFKAKRSFSNFADAEDVVQETLILAYRHIGQFEGRSQLTTWITSILVNQIRMKFRKDKINRVALTDSLNTKLHNTDFEFQDLLESKDIPIDKQVESKERARLVLYEIKKLPLSQQKPLKLIMVGARMDEVARVLRSPIGSAKANVFRGRAKLRASLAKGACAS